jgi:hypothetical protein
MRTPNMLLTASILAVGPLVSAPRAETGGVADSRVHSRRTDQPQLANAQWYPFPRDRRGNPYPGDRYPGDRYPGRNRDTWFRSIAYEHGYEDGFDKGREDARDRDRYDPSRHKRYRKADHGYDRDYGRKDAYQLYYREAFTRGYAEAYRLNGRWSGRGGDSRRGWPF